MMLHWLEETLRPAILSFLDEYEDRQDSSSGYPGGKAAQRQRAWQHRLYGSVERRDSGQQIALASPLAGAMRMRTYMAGL
jgi:hypothetical protein